MHKSNVVLLVTFLAGRFPEQEFCDNISVHERGLAVPNCAGAGFETADSR